jgi:hypothetical protein
MVEKTGQNGPFAGKIPNEAKDHMRAAREELRESIKVMLPPEFLEHRRKAGKELLLAWRSIIDAAITRIEEKEKAS